MTPLIDGLLARLNDQLPAGTPKKKLSVGARNALLQHRWLGNIRELEGTLWRASVWAAGPTIDEQHVREALFAAPTRQSESILGRALGEGFNLEATLGEVARHYLARALAETGDNQTKAAELVGFSNHQRLKKWMKKHGLQK